MQRKLILALSLVLFLTILTAGCSTGNNSSETIIESGVINTDYMGNPNPQLVVEMKLTPAEKEGNFEKIPAKTNSAVTQPETETVDKDDPVPEADAAEAPRPTI